MTGELMLGGGNYIVDDLRRLLHLDGGAEYQVLKQVEMGPQ